jgi:hypothetical protein
MVFFLVVVFFFLFFVVVVILARLGSRVHPTGIVTLLGTVLTPLRDKGRGRGELRPPTDTCRVWGGDGGVGGLKDELDPIKNK